MGNDRYKTIHAIQGLCLFCSRKVKPGKRLCPIHNQNNIDANKRLRIRRVENHQCVVCGRSLDVLGITDRKSCPLCSHKNARELKPIKKRRVYGIYNQGS
jgi:DNA-directed RNA polymerase subunit RPC12/RpoP